MLPISSEKWKEVEALLDKALDLPVSQRTVFLEEASQGDEVLRDLLMEFWEAGLKAEDFLEGDIPSDVVKVINQLTVEEAYGPAPYKGMRFGDFEVIEEIGRGGMSVVYKAKRVDGQFEQTVALKILKRGMDTDQLVRRFLSERQILAGLQHANIARLIDGGATKDGRPYLIMEYVKGMPITKYCDEHKLDINSRLALFKKVGAAVDFAHRNLVVHRDLKPSNILVTNEEEVKLLDFGIAKVLSADLDETVLALTMAGGRVMTPEYAAPEQIFGDAITTATDVYAMGVLLYELLCGQLPIRYDARRVSAIERIMRSSEMSLPSVFLKQQGKSDQSTIEEIASARGTTTLLLTQKLEGDLDMIVQMALRKDPERRYRFVSEFIDEVERYQQGLPVKARPDTLGYRARKFYGRYRFGVISASIALLLLITSLIGTILQAREASEQSMIASQERDVAQREAAKSARITEFIVDVFESIDPDISEGDTLTAYQILERGAQKLENELGEEPALQTDIMTVIGRMYQRMGAYDEAERWLSRALTKRQTLFDKNAIEVLDGAYNMGSLMQDQGRYAEAESLLQQVLSEPYDVSDAGVELQFAKTQELLGSVLADNGQYEAAKSIYEQSLYTQTALIGEEHSDVASVYVNLGDVLEITSDFEGAVGYFQKAVEIYRANPEGHADDVADALLSLSEANRNRGAFEDAERYCREALTINRKLFGEAHPRVIKVMNQLGSILSEMGRNEDAERIYLDALSIQVNTLGEKHPDTIELLGNLGGNYIRMGNLKQAVVHLKEALALREAVLGKDHPTVAIALSNLGVALGSLGDYQEAERIHRKSLVMTKKYFGEDHPGVAVCASNLANVLYKLERYNEALPHADLAIKIDKETLEPNHRFVAATIAIKGQILFELGQIKDAQQHLQEAIDIYERSGLPADHHIPMRPKIALGKLHISQGRLEQAKPLLEETLRIRQKAFEPDDWRIGEAEAALGIYHLEKGERGAAEKYLKEGLKRLQGALGERHRLSREAEGALARLIAG